MGGCRVLRVALAGLCVLVVGTVPGTASATPASTVDVGEPVPLDPPPVPPALPFDPQADARNAAEITTDAALATQPATRAFGTEPYQDTAAAAASEASARRAAGCSISNARLAGIMLAITFTEAGPLASTTVAPSPMTLSRWDTQPILYSFGTASTAFPRAFWHPGIGLWQFDHPWDNTATERIDTRPAAALAADVIAGRWCGWTSSTGTTQFQYTVRPWHGCDDEIGPGNRCLEIFNHHFRPNGCRARRRPPGRVHAPAGRDPTRRCSLHVVPAGGRDDRAPVHVRQPSRRPGEHRVAIEHRTHALGCALLRGHRRRPRVALLDAGRHRLRPRHRRHCDHRIRPRSTLTWQVGSGLCELGPNKGACAALPPCAGRCFFLTNGTLGGAAQVAFWDDQPSSQVFVGDWNGDGVDTFGFRVSNSFVLKNRLAPGPADVTFSYGQASDVVLVGDWNGDGRDTLGVRGQTNYLKNSLSGGAADVTFSYGQASDVVLVGDWNADRRSTLAVRRGRTYYIRNSLSGGPADVTFVYGLASDEAHVGDWNRDRRDTLGVRR
ncbi:MAG TPA: hypothetical protein VFH23_11605 [Jiangellaceae bacterium]|nr:hypothetical protein [Jiangellaceae bacterium]